MNHIEFPEIHFSRWRRFRPIAFELVRSTKRLLYIFNGASTSAILNLSCNVELPLVCFQCISCAMPLPTDVVSGKGTMAIAIATSPDTDTHAWRTKKGQAVFLLQHHPLPTVPRLT